METRGRPREDGGKVWVSASICVGAQAWMRMDRRMPADWTLASLRAEFARTIGWAGFGLSSADQRNEFGEITLTRKVGPVELVEKPTAKNQWRNVA